MTATRRPATRSEASKDMDVITRMISQSGPQTTASVQEDTSTERPARAAIAGAVIAALITLPGLGDGTLWDNSETAYGEVAREILLTRDWLVMHHNGQPWYIQPPLYFWIAAIFAKIFGVTTFALRLPAALSTIA